MCTDRPFDAMCEILKKSLAHFNTQEQYLIQNDLSERCICARFAMHLTQALQETVYQDYIRFLYKGIIINHNKNRANLH